jgi:HEPN domain-containing protein
MRRPEDVRRDLVRQWLAKAEGDLEAARVLLSQETSFLFPVGFHSQQAAEKYLKAFLTWHSIPFPKTHDLDELLDLVASMDQSLSQSLRAVAALTPFGEEIRYPGDAPDPTREKAEEALALGEDVQAAVVGALPREFQRP